MQINPVSQNMFSKAFELLKENNLPTQDISKATNLFIATHDNKVVGTVGIEFYKDVALLRSLAVAYVYRGQGIGKQLVEYIERLAKKNGTKELILLTTTASGYFSKRAYQNVERNDVPEKIKNSSEFSTICPASAIVMKKVL